MRPIDADALTEKCGDWYVEEGTEEGFIGTLGQLLSVQPETNCSDIPNSSDTISRQQAIDKFKPWLEVKGYDWGELNMLRAVINELENMPSVQPDIIRCKDCKWRIRHDKRCGYWNHGVKPTMWCSQAERREDE